MQILFTIKQRQTGGKNRKRYLKSKTQLKLGICIMLMKDFYTSSDIIFPFMSGRIIEIVTICQNERIFFVFFKFRGLD